VSIAHARSGPPQNAAKPRKMDRMTQTTVIEGLDTRLKVGMEVHVELATRTKMWTAAPNVAHPDNYDAEPNSLIDPIVIGMPGTLPVMNRAAVEMSMKIGLALHCAIAPWSKWDRKSYYYPDLPKNYQISQYEIPLCSEGVLEIPVDESPTAASKSIRIIRAHLEEDAGKLAHDAPGGRPIDYSIVDLNRAGTPLLEIVTYPDFETADEAVMFGQTLRNICRFLGVTEGIMQRGHIRFEPNINVIIERDGKTYATPIAEIKNLNSFKAVRGAIEHEHRRQVEQFLKDGKTLVHGSKSTRGWDDARSVTFLQREKEEAQDYRYFPDPDLVPVTVTADWLEAVRATIPELPLARSMRYVRDFDLSHSDAKTLTAERDICFFFEAVIAAGVAPKRATAILLNNLAKLANERGVMASDLGITPQQIKSIDDMQTGSKISSSGAGELYALCITAGPAADPAALAEQKGLLQVSDDGALDAWIDQVIAGNEKAVAQIKAGKEQAITALIGGVMKLSKGKANPRVVTDKIRSKLLG
jgi:aspartyl-tRNA(Asn)/glutamyl-tRNA(Gln) amidotransferase subunit B